MRFLILLTAVAALAAPVCPAPQPISTVTVTDGSAEGLAKLYGSGENYITDLKVTVKFKYYAPYDIKLEDGYSPSLSVFDFGAEDKLLFCSSQTGGSGGYGNYRVYRVKTHSYELLYDDKADSEKMRFSAEFQPDGVMKIVGADGSLDVCLGYTDKYFYDLIFAPDGSVKDAQPHVNDVSFVSPSFNPASGIYRLTTYRSVTAVAEVNRLGYITQLLDFDGGFTPSFTEFSIAF